jgi:hypothetical protein
MRAAPRPFKRLLPMILCSRPVCFRCCESEYFSEFILIGSFFCYFVNFDVVLSLVIL